MKAIGRSITPHTLRHTHASLLMEQGIDIDSISKRLGHNDSKVTKEIYLHVTQKLESKRNEQLKAIKIFLILELQKSLWYYLPIHKEKISVHNNSIRR